MCAPHAMVADHHKDTVVRKFSNAVGEFSQRDFQAPLDKADVVLPRLPNVNQFDPGTPDDQVPKVGNADFGSCGH